jgi:hypothetical protein
MNKDAIEDMIEVALVEPCAFRKVRESLTRMGVAHKGDNTLYQSCHILHKAGHYYICHFKEMYALDGRYTTLSEEDIARRNIITKMLQDWKLLTVLDSTKLIPLGEPKLVKVIKFNEVDDWNLVPKYKIGVRH